MANPVLDVFNGDAFGMVSLTEGIDKIPYDPGRIQQMGLFNTEGITTEFAKIEERHGKLTLIQSAPKGTMPEFDIERSRNARLFEVPYLPQNDSITANDVANVREFNSANRMEGVGSVVADRMAQLKQNHSATWEWHMAKALNGEVLDADGTTVIYNWYNEFNITQKVFTITDSIDGDVQKQSNDIRRWIIDALGGTSFTGIRAFVNAGFMDAFQSFTNVVAAYNRWQDGAFLRQDNVYNEFELHKIVWEEYRNVRSVDTGTAVIDIPYIGDVADTPMAFCFPTGTRNVFKRYNSPAQFMETINTKGKDIYVKQVRNKWDTAIDLHTQSNPLIVNQRPACCVKVLLA